MPDKKSKFNSDFNQDELVADMLSDSSSEIIVGPDGTIMPKNEAIKDNIEGTKLLKQRVWGAPENFNNEPDNNSEYADFSKFDCDYNDESDSEIIETDETSCEQKLSFVNNSEKIDLSNLNNMIFGNDSIITENTQSAACHENDSAVCPDIKLTHKITIFKEFMKPGNLQFNENGYAKINFIHHPESLCYIQNIFGNKYGSICSGAVLMSTAEEINCQNAITEFYEQIISRILNLEKEVKIILIGNRTLTDYAAFVCQNNNSDNFELTPAKFEFVALSEDIFSRNKFIIESSEFKNKKITLVGLGSMGSNIALELARAGVGTFTLIDIDRLSAVNVCRHTCGLDDIGRYKVYAVKDKILKINPFANIAVSTADVTIDIEATKTLCRNSDLIITSTDTTSSRRLINYICKSMQIPAIFSGVFERASGGRIFKVEPDLDSACLECHQIETFEEKPGFVPYSSAADPRELTIQPGLSTDISITTMLTVKMAIDSLKENKDNAMPYNLLILKLFSAKDKIMDPIKFLCAKNENISPNPNCPVCGENSLLRNIGR